MLTTEDMDEGIDSRDRLLGICEEERESLCELSRSRVRQVREDCLRCSLWKDLNRTTTIYSTPYALSDVAAEVVT